MRTGFASSATSAGKDITFPPEMSARRPSASGAAPCFASRLTHPRTTMSRQIGPPPRTTIRPLGSHHPAWMSMDSTRKRTRRGACRVPRPEVHPGLALPMTGPYRSLPVTRLSSLSRMRKRRRLPDVPRKSKSPNRALPLMGFHSGRSWPSHSSAGASIAFSTSSNAPPTGTRHSSLPPPISATSTRQPPRPKRTRWSAR